MILRVPDYYDEFSCIADRCRHSCCIGWEIDIDEDTCEYYKNTKGAFGDRLRKELFVTSEGDNSFRLADQGRCPFLDSCNLCDIYKELGEEALSEVCTEYPRFSLWYGNTLHKVLSISCEEVGRILFTASGKTGFRDYILSDEENEALDDEYETGDCEETDRYYEDGDCEEIDRDSEDEGYEEPEELIRWEEVSEYESDEEEAETIARLEAAMEDAFELLQCREMPLKERISRLIRNADRERPAQEGTVTDQAETAEKEESAEMSAEWKEREWNSYAWFTERIAPFLEMETLDAEWDGQKKAFAGLFDAESYPKILSAYVNSPDYCQRDYEQLMVYFVFRYLMNAVRDYDELEYYRLAVIFTLVIRDMDALRYTQNGGHFTREDRIDVARIFSREVEHSQDNVDMICEAILFEPVYGSEQLVRQL